ncbi:MAG TPA: arginine deiminase family protein [Gemmatimonadales bacterium]|nr:arginine deiminase family protein [Gemmatimonadales bacterium]
MTEDGTHFTAAIARTPAGSFAQGLTTAGLGAPDLERALRQHAAYCDALERLGVRVTVLPPDPAHPDSTFVEDTAVVTARGAMLSRPGAPSRAGEVVAMREALQPRVAALASIREPGTLDGGDICQAGVTFFIGLSHRTNEEGARQLAAWLEDAGYAATTIDIRGSATLLHLKSGIAWLGGREMVVAEALAAHPALQAYRLIVVPADETYAANCVRVNDAVLMAAGFPALAERVAALGHRVVTLEMSEFRKMDGGLSCLSLRLP